VVAGHVPENAGAAEIPIERIGNVGIDVGETLRLPRGDVVEHQLADDAVSGDVDADAERYRKDTNSGKRPRFLKLRKA
jgi:hypothetical protein